MEASTQTTALRPYCPLCCRVSHPFSLSLSSTCSSLVSLTPHRLVYSYSFLSKLTSFVACALQFSLPMSSNYLITLKFASFPHWVFVFFSKNNHFFMLVIKQRTCWDCFSFFCVEHYGEFNGL